MSFFADIASASNNNRSTERKALPVGAYGYQPKDRSKPAFPASLLKIVKYIGERDTKDPELKQYSFLVASDGQEGTAFLSLSLKKLWLEPAAIGLAFNNFDKAIEQGLTTREEVDIVNSHIREVAHNKVGEANTPAEEIETATDMQVEKVLTSIRINAGLLYRLMGCAGIETDARELDFNLLVHAQFAGEVVAGRNGDTSDVKSVYKPKVQ